MNLCQFLGIRSLKAIGKCPWKRWHLEKWLILAPGANFHVNRLITYLGIPSNTVDLNERNQVQHLILSLLV